MDRLSAVERISRALPSSGCTLIGVALVLLGCDQGGDGGRSAPPSRVVAVAASEEPSVEELCDVTPEGDEAPALVLPELAVGQTPPSLGGRRWLNVWATWCRPCVEELPLLRRWKERLARDGVDVGMIFLSADASDETVARYRSDHAGAPDGLRIADPQELPRWATAVGLDEGATLPIHVWTDRDGRVRCARTGAVDEDDYENVRDVLSDR